jgi:hypothetical protein
MVTQLANGLGDPGKVFWLDAELKLYIKESLRTWNSMAMYYKAQSSFNTVNGTAFYDLTTELSTDLGFTLQDRDIITDIEYSLLEPPTPTSWTGTEMFTLQQLTDAIQNRRNQFLLETGLIVTRTTQAITGSVLSPASRISLTSDLIMTIRRLAWLVSSTYTQLWRQDEIELNTYSVGSLTTAASTPQSYSVALTPNLTVQIAPPANANGTLEILSINAPAALDPSTGVLMNIPDDFCWAIKFGALADLLGGDGQRSDPMRSDYCEKRYREGVELARVAVSIEQARIAGSPVQPISIKDLDAYLPGWQNTTDDPTMLGVEAYNLIALSPVPDAAFSITLDLVRKAPMPSANGDNIDLGREELDAVIDYAHHLAAFKMGGAEFQQTMPHYERLMRLASVQNSILRANSFNFDVLTDRAQREEYFRPRRSEAAD